MKNSSPFDLFHDEQLSELELQVAFLEAAYVRAMGSTPSDPGSRALFPFGWYGKGAYYRLTVLAEAIEKHCKIKDCDSFYPLIEEGLVTSADQILVCENGHQTVDFCRVGIKKCPQCGRPLVPWDNRPQVKAEKKTAAPTERAFYRGDQFLCEVRKRRGRKPTIDNVEIELPEQTWVSEFDMEITLTNGTVRIVRDQMGDNEVFRLVLENILIDPRYYLVFPDGRKINVEEDGNAISFRQGSAFWTKVSLEAQASAVDSPAREANRVEKFGVTISGQPVQIEQDQMAAILAAPLLMF